MNNPEKTLKGLIPEREFFIGIDSDGCAFDTMEIKHKECFCPAFINRFELQAVSRYAREAWEFVNLYSRDRGVNRFIGVLKSLNILSEREETVKRNVKIPRMESLEKWINSESKLGDTALKKIIGKEDNPELETLYKWSQDVNDAVNKIVRNVPPFPYVRESLERISEKADSMVISQAPVEVLNREWEEHGIKKFVKLIAGQEMGTKTEHIRLAAGGKYKPGKILMIGDAPGDLKAAKDNNALYFPIIPGQEDKSWELFYREGLDRFLEGTYSGEYETSLINEFLKNLPEHPPWAKA